MNLDVVSKAAEAYKDGASEADAARLDFFEELYRIQQKRADSVAESLDFDPLPREEADRAYTADEPLFTRAPAPIDSARFFGTCGEIAVHLARHAGLEDEAAAGLREIDWRELAGKLDLEAAGSNPPGFIETCLKDFDSLGIGPDVPASVVMMVIAFALRAHIQPAAERAFRAVSEDVASGARNKHPVNCPVCGSPAAASRVGAASGIEGRDREQYCSLCGTVWPFERMRCGVCGAENATRLHYFHVEGDSSHRLQNCDECGQYQRVLFEEDLSIPVSMEVEDVVMAKLDAVALDPRFREK